jgi:hypothetical protein
MRSVVVLPAAVRPEQRIEFAKANGEIVDRRPVKARR